MAQFTRLAGQASAILLIGLGPAWMISDAQAFRLESPVSPSARVEKSPSSAPPFLHWDIREFDQPLQTYCGILPYCASSWPTIPGAGPEFVIREAFSRLSLNGSSGLSGFSTVDPPASCPPPHPYPAQDDYNVVLAAQDSLVFVDADLDPGHTLGSFGPDVGVPAWTFIWSDPTGRILEADIVLNNSPNRGFTWVARQDGDAVNWPPQMPGQVPYPPLGLPYECDLKTVVMHEIGHLLGLGDSDDANSIMNLQAILVSGKARHQLGADDKAGFTFLYSSDLGDAPDPPYSTMVRETVSPLHGRLLNGLARPLIRPGPAHLFGARRINGATNCAYEWLGGARGPTQITHLVLPKSNGVDGECGPEVTNRDAYDDGISYAPNPAIGARLMQMTAWVNCANDAQGEGHDYSGDHGRPLYVNVWCDFDGDGTWDPSEQAISAGVVPTPRPVGPNSSSLTTISRDVYVPNPSQMQTKIWARARLDWGENAGAAEGRIDPSLNQATGAAQFGEVEDFPIDLRRGKDLSCTVKIPRFEAIPGIKWHLAGQPGGGRDYYAEVDSSGCELQRLEDPTAIYDSEKDETVLSYEDSSHSCLPGHWYRMSRSEPDSARLTPLRREWIGLGDSLSSGIPQVNCAIGDLPGGGLRVFVGAVNDSAGGDIRSLSGAPGLWADSLQVSVSYRISPSEIDFDQLSACDSTIASLADHFVGTADVWPDAPGWFDVTDIAPGENLLVDVATTWSVNGNMSRELYEFTNPGAVTAVENPSRSLRRGLIAWAYPVPSVQEVHLGFIMPESSPARVEVYSASGAHVASIASDRILGSGAQVWTWNGRTDSGTRARPGVYFLRVLAGPREGTAKAVLVR